MSLPARERGLKPKVFSFTLLDILVAPRAGAWIETCPIVQGRKSVIKSLLARELKSAGTVARRTSLLS